MTRCIGNYQNKQAETAFASLLRDIYIFYFCSLAKVPWHWLFTNKADYSTKDKDLDFSWNLRFTNSVINKCTAGPDAFLTPEQYLIIVSSLMGDGSMNIDFDTKNPLKRSYFKFSQSFNQPGHAEYCKYKFEILKNLCNLTGPSKGSVDNKKKGLEFDSFTFSTQS